LESMDITSITHSHHAQLTAALEQVLRQDIQDGIARRANKKPKIGEADGRIDEVDERCARYDVAIKELLQQRNVAVAYAATLETQLKEVRHLLPDTVQMALHSDLPYLPLSPIVGEREQNEEEEEEEEEEED